MEEGGAGSELEEDEDSFVDIDNVLNPEEEPARRILRLRASCSFKIWEGGKGGCSQTWVH